MWLRFLVSQSFITVAVITLYLYLRRMNRAGTIPDPVRKSRLFILTSILVSSIVVAFSVANIVQPR